MTQTQISARLENAMQFVAVTFGAGQELLVFLTQLENLPGISPFLKQSGRYNALLRSVLPE